MFLDTEREHTNSNPIVAFNFFGILMIISSFHSLGKISASQYFSIREVAAAGAGEQFPGDIVKCNGFTLVERIGDNDDFNSERRLNFS